MSVCREDLTIRVATVIVILLFLIFLLFHPFPTSLVILFLSLIRLYNVITCGYYYGRERMDGKTVIITGGSDGIGKETAREIAMRGARVIMTCRNMKKGILARDSIIKSTRNNNVVLKKLDLSSQKSVIEFARDILNTESRLDVLIHNAATAETTFQKSDDNIELNIATNHLGPFLLTHLLIDLLKKSAPSRIVIVASSTYPLGRLHLNLNPPSFWLPVYFYSVSKYCIVSFTLELSRRLKGTNVTVNCLHPGAVDTNIFRNIPLLQKIFITLSVKYIFKSPAQGCQTSVFLACTKDVEGVSGKYFIDCVEEKLGYGVTDELRSKKLWELSQRLSNLETTETMI